MRRAFFGLLCWLALACVLPGLSVAPAAAKRVALVIGNADYKVGPLQNPVSDARAIAEALDTDGFDRVILRHNLGIEKFREALREISRESVGSDLGVIYFAGHGIESNGRNYLIPIDANLARPSDLSLEAISLDAVLEQLDGAAKLKLVILDACRQNIFPLAAVSRGLARGLSRIEPAGNTLVVYAAKAGSTAEDGAGQRHSPFTQALLRHMVTPGLEVNFVFRYVRDDVLTATNGVQEPYVYGSLGRKEIYLRPAAASAKLSPPAPPAPVPAVKPAAKVPSNRGAGPLSSIEERALRPKDEFRECADCPEMIVVPSGTFTMGSAAENKWARPEEAPPHSVTIPNFGAGKFEVTVEEYLVFLTDALKGGHYEKRWILTAPKQPDSSIALDAAELAITVKAGHEKHPVSFVSWHGAEAYAKWLTKRTGGHYRLLSEAEWEYAARAGSADVYHFGDDARQLCNYGNIADISGQRERRWVQVTACDDGYAGVAPVGKFQPNAFGLHDMLGNVAEWVADCSHPTYAGAPGDGSAWLTGGDCNLQIVRGGSYFNFAWAARPATRYMNRTYSRFANLGFRIARTLRQ